jgi:hypothetical protein
MTWEKGKAPKPGRANASARLRWALRDYQTLTFEQKTKKRLNLLMRLAMLDELLQVDGGETVLTPGQGEKWIQLYQLFHPSKDLGRPKS